MTRSLRISTLAAWLPLVVVGAPVSADAVAPDKSVYTLFNPTPEKLRREMVTDRPDATESPFTVDAGHVQLEMDFANLTRNRLDGGSTTEWSVAPFNLRIGLLSHMEAGIFVSPYAGSVETSRGGPRETHTGFGDVTLRGKWNFWGNDGGATAFGLIADVSLPTGKGGMGRGKTEGAVIFPFAFELADGWGAGAMTGAELRYRGLGGGYRTGWINTVMLGYPIAKDFSGYVELTSAAGEGGHVATFNVGVAWKLDANLQFDSGAKLGASRAADEVALFAGMSRRF